MSASLTPHDQPRRFRINVPALVGAGLVAITIWTAFEARLHKPSDVPASTAVVVRELRFADMPNGSVVVINATDGRTIDILPPESNNFLRATMRGLAQQRIRTGLDGTVPFRLTSWQDGRLTLADPATGRSVELESFGETNKEAFARLLTLDGGAP